MRSLATARITLEPQVASHAAEMFRILNDPALYAFENEPPASLEWLYARFQKLESRRSADGSEQWLNWVIRLTDTSLIGYVQATILPDSTAGIAYVLASAFWGKGLASEAVLTMCDELAARYGVRRFSAVLKRANLRSRRLLERLAFSQASPEQLRHARLEPDELWMLRDSSVPWVKPATAQPVERRKTAGGEIGRSIKKT